MNTYYSDTLYPLQDKVLARIEKLGSSFYLTGGTALSRFHLQHRYSDDLDFFTNQDPNFRQDAQDVIDHLQDLQPTILHRSDTYFSLIIEDILKLEFVNDVQHRFGDTVPTPLFPRIDNILNILSNKLTALIGRDEPKDVVDIWAIATHSNIDWPTIFTDANSKAVGIFPPEIVKRLEEFPPELLNQIKWIKQSPSQEQFQQDIREICDQIITPVPSAIH